MLELTALSDRTPPDYSAPARRRPPHAHDEPRVCASSCTWRAQATARRGCAWTAAEIRVHGLTPTFKVYILDGTEKFFGFYPVIEHDVTVQGKAHPMYDLMGKDAVLFYYVAEDPSRPTASSSPKRRCGSTPPGSRSPPTGHDDALGHARRRQRRPARFRRARLRRLRRLPGHRGRPARH